jgi:hypothetical protein
MTNNNTYYYYYYFKGKWRYTFCQAGTNDSEEPAGTAFRAEVTSTLKMNAAGSFKMLVNEYTKPHGVTSKKTATFIFIATTTSNG